MKLTRNNFLLRISSIEEGKEVKNLLTSLFNIHPGKINIRELSPNNRIIINRSAFNKKLKGARVTQDSLMQISDCEYGVFIENKINPIDHAQNICQKFNYLIDPSKFKNLEHSPVEVLKAYQSILNIRKKLVAVLPI